MLRGVYARTVQKHKSYGCGNPPDFKPSFGCTPSVYGNAPRLSNKGGRSLIVQLEHPAIDTAKSIANPTRFSNTPVSYRLPPPLPGEHWGAILQSLGYSAEDTRTMAADSAT